MYPLAPPTAFHVALNELLLAETARFEGEVMAAADGVALSKEPGPRAE